MTESATGQESADHEVEADLLTEESTPPETVPAQQTPDSMPDSISESTPPQSSQPSRSARSAQSSQSSATKVVETIETADGIQEFEVTRLEPLPDEEPDRPRNPLRRLANRVVLEARDPSPGLVLSLAYIILAIGLTWKLLLHPVIGLIAANPYDQIYFEWQLTAVQHAVLHLQNPLFSHAMNAPDGMNLEGNPQIIGPAVVLTPITYLFGASVSYALLTTFNLAGTAITWRWFLRRHVVRTETAAFLGGLFMGFSPSMMSHTLGHPNLTGQWLVPLILGRLLRLREPEHTVRNGVVLGLLIAAQVFVGEELLFLAALGCAFFLIAYAVNAPRRSLAEAGTFLKGSAIAIATSAVLLAYPLTFQLAGPQSFTGIPFDIAYYSADLKSYAVYPSMELWGDPDKLDKLAPGSTEQAALVGWVLLLVVVALTLWCLRNPAVRALLIAGLGLVALSLGTAPVYSGRPITWWWWPLPKDGVWTALKDLPAFSSSLPIRSALAVSWVIGVLLAIGVDKAVEHRWYWLRGLALGASAVALVPLLPRVLDTIDRNPVPAYFTAGTWKECVSAGRNTIVGVPLPSNGERAEMAWATAAGGGFDMPQGPAMIPNSPTDKHVVFGKENILWTAQWLTYISKNGGGSTPPVDAGIKSRVAQDLAIWKANCVVAADNTANLDALRSFLDQAIAPGVAKDGVVVWKAPSH